MAINKNTPPDIVGEPFKEYVNGQIRVRQQSHGSGFKSTRSDKDLVYLNSRNAWIKMASSVDVIGQPPPVKNTSLSRGNIIRQDTLNEQSQAGIKKLQELGLDPNLTGDQLSKKAILFNGISEFGNTTQPGGIASNNSIFNNSAYGFGGSKYGIQPMPGITNFTIGHNNIGSIRTATVNIRAHSPLQFGIINLLYIRLGYSMLIEWGNSMYLDNNGKLQKMGPTLMDEVWFKGKGITPNEFNVKTEEKREQYNGNYDGFFGKVVNFEYKFNTDGSYNIELKLISQGDVVESFKLDTLSPEFTLLDGNDVTEEKELDQNNILNVLYCFETTLDEKLKEKIKEENQGNLTTTEEEKLEGDNLQDILSSKNGDIVNPYAQDKAWVGIVKGTIYDRYYLRFGYFLQFLKNLLLVNSTQGTPYPELEFNVSLKNYSKNYSKELISFNPDICFINNGPKAGLDPSIFGDFKRYDIDGNPFVGTLLNIYIEGNFIQDTIKNIINTEGKLTVFNLLKAICNGINTSLADVTALYPTLQDDYMVVIRDANLDVRTGKEGVIIDQEISSETIELFGYNTSKATPQSNFVKDFDFSTTISKDLASMISIGATAANTDVSEYSGFFANLNKGLEDRFKTSNSVITNTKPLSDSCKREKKTPVTITANFYGGSSVVQTKRASYSLTKKESNPQSKDEKLKSEWKTWKEKSLDEKTNVIFLGEENYLPYFSTEGEVNWERGKQLFISTVKNKDNVKESTLPKNVTSSNIGFIPMGVDLTLDGLGGMKVYNQLKVNSQHLPVGYPDELELVIIGIDHQIQDNSWITKVRTYTKPTSQPWGTEMDSSVMDYNPKSAFSTEVITSFTQEDPAPDINPEKLGNQKYDGSATALYLKSQQQQNGKLDSNKYLTNVEGKYFLENTAAEFYNLWMKDLAGRGLEITLFSAYRTTEEQRNLVNISTEPGRATSPGTSAHGWGGAVDFVEFSNVDTSIEANKNIRVNNPLWRQIAAVGATYGWFNPWRLSDEYGRSEAWHFEYWGGNEAKIINTPFQGIKILPN